MEPVRPSESESRNRVLDAAYPLFVQQGYKAVSMQQIADAVSINKATLYHHFRSKDDLFLAVVHVAWISKADLLMPASYLLALAVLMLARWPVLRRWRALRRLPSFRSAPESPS